MNYSLMNGVMQGRVIAPADAISTIWSSETPMEQPLAGDFLTCASLHGLFHVIARQVTEQTIELGHHPDLRAAF